MFKHWARNFLTYELILSILIAICAFFLIKHFTIDIDNILKQTRLQIYATIASTSGALLGFVITSISILLTMKESPTILILKNSPHYRTVFDVFLSTSRYLAFTSIASLTGILIDKDNSPHIWFFYLILWVVIISILRLLRCLWILEKMIDLSVRNKG